ncbi:MAG: thioredoxin [Candidatus Buchananbacteria bacterium]
MSELILTDSNFESEVLKGTGPVLVDFFAPWCGPCQIQGPIIEELAKDLAGQPVKVAKMNIEENQTTAGKFGIMSIPTLMIFKDGKMIEEMHGVTPKEILAEKLKKLA